MTWPFSRARYADEGTEQARRLDTATECAAHHRIEAALFRDLAARAMVDAENSERLSRLYEARVAEATKAVTRNA